MAVLTKSVVVKQCRLVAQRKLRIADSRGEVTEATEKALNRVEVAGRGDNPAIGRPVQRIERLLAHFIWDSMGRKSPMGEIFPVAPSRVCLKPEISKLFR
jgi:hypothetical protein